MTKITPSTIFIYPILNIQIVRFLLLGNSIAGTPTPTLGSPINIVHPGSQGFYEKTNKKETTKKISFDFKIIDMNDEAAPRTTTPDAMKMKTKDLTNETLEGNNSFIIHNGVPMPVEKVN